MNSKSGLTIAKQLRKPIQCKKDEELKKTITAALIAALKTANKDELKAVSDQNVSVAPQPNATTQIILISASGKSFKKADIPEYLTWVATALKLKPEVKPTVPMPTTDTFDRMVVTIGAPASAVVEGLTK